MKKLESTPIPKTKQEFFDMTMEVMKERNWVRSMHKEVPSMCSYNGIGCAIGVWFPDDVLLEGATVSWYPQVDHIRDLEKDGYDERLVQVLEHGVGFLEDLQDAHDGDYDLPEDEPPGSAKFRYEAFADKYELNKDVLN